MKIVKEIPGSEVLEEFESYHPEPIRWSLEYKKQFIGNKNTKAIYVRQPEPDREYIGEILLSWNSDNVVEVCSITVKPQYRGKNYGKLLIAIAMDWARTHRFEIMMGDAREGASWNAFKYFGAWSVYRNKNWSNTGETYVHFFISLNTDKDEESEKEFN
jgi:GNAT superfamily N-acetyltransferase